MPHAADPKRPDRVMRYAPNKDETQGSSSEHINALGMVCSLVGLLIKVFLLGPGVDVSPGFKSSRFAVEVGRVDWCVLFSGVYGQ